MYINLHSSYCILRITENSRSNNGSKYLKRTNKYISEITKIYRIIKCDWQKKKNDIFKNNISCIKFVHIRSSHPNVLSAENVRSIK